MGRGDDGGVWKQISSVAQEHNSTVFISSMPDSIRNEMICSGVSSGKQSWNLATMRSRFSEDFRNDSRSLAIASSSPSSPSGSIQKRQGGKRERKEGEEIRESRRN